MTRYTFGDSDAAGDRLELLADTFEPMSRVVDHVVMVVPRIEVVARIFSMNLDVLVADGEVTARPDMAAGLERAAHSGGEVRWRFRQMVWERAS